MKDFIIENYFEHNGFFKFISKLIDNMSNLIDSNAYKIFRTKKRTELTLEKIKNYTNFPLNKFDKKNYYIKNFVIALLSLENNYYLKVGLYQEPSRFLMTFLGSLYGHIRLANNNNLSKLDKEYKSLMNKKILILGTGPSIKKLNSKILSSYDHIFLLNKAIYKYDEINSELKNIDRQISLSFFCCDRNRIYEVKDHLNKINIPVSRKIFFPDYPISIIKTDLNKIKATIIGGNKAWRNAYCGYGKGNLYGWHMLYTETPINFDSTKENIIKRVLNNGPNVYIPYTVAFSCITFISGYKPMCIDLLGCDFSDAFEANPMNQTFELISDTLRDLNIKCTNISKNK